MLNHDTVASVAGFMAGAARAGVTIPVIAAVAIFTDPASASALSGLPSMRHLGHERFSVAASSVLLAGVAGKPGRGSPVKHR